MSIQGSINQMIASVGAAVGAAEFALRQKKAANKLMQHQMEMLKVRTAAREKIERRKAAIERQKLKHKTNKEKTPEQELLAMGINPSTIETLKKKGTI